MIRILDEEQIIETFASILTYGLNKGLSSSLIEEHILKSQFINDLEDNKFDNKLKDKVILKSIYKENIIEVDLSFLSLFIAESYIRLFFDLNKSFAYLFLYWPLDQFIFKFDIYHEMDYSSLKIDFMERVHNTSLLKALIKSRHLKLNDVGKLTSININTLDKYMRSDKYLYAASYANIYKLAKLFNVKENIFIESLDVYYDDSSFSYDDEHNEFISKLGFYFASYFDKRVDNFSFTYQKEKNIFIDFKNGYKLIVKSLKNEEINRASLFSSVDDKTYLVIFLNGRAAFNDDDIKEQLNALNAYEIMLISKETYLLKKETVKKSDSSIYDMLYIKAKEDKTIS